MDPRETMMDKAEFETTPTASYLPFLDQVDSPPSQTKGSGTAGRRRARDSGFFLPRRREAQEPLRVRLAPQQLYWLRLAAARAGRKIDESVIVSAALALVEWLDIDWRTIGSRADVEKSLARVVRSLASPRSPVIDPSPPASAPPIPAGRSAEPWPAGDPFRPGDAGGDDHGVEP